MFALHASVAMNASEPPTQSGFVTQYSTEPMPAANRPQDIFIHSYGPPSWVKVVPSSAMRSAYGSTNATARMTTQANVWAPNPDTWPSVSRPTSAQIVKKSMSNLRSDFWRCPFSSRAIAVVCSTTGCDEDIRSSQ